MLAIIFSGIQATGKTTFYVQHFLRSHVHISLDLLKTRHREQQFFDLCLATQMPCVIDNTNPTREDRQRYINAAKARKYEVVGYVFQSDIAIAIQRNSLRKGKENIPEIGIKSTFKKLEPVTQDEGFDKIFDILTIDNQFIIKERKNEI